jgi:hypothetical protein
MYRGGSKLSLVGVPISVSPTPAFGGDSAGGGRVGGSKGKASTGGAKAGEDSRGPQPAGAGANKGGDGTAPIRDGPTQVEAVVADMLSCTDSVRVIEVEHRSEGALGGDPSALGSLRGPGSYLPNGSYLGDVTSAPRVLRHCGLRGQ